MRALQSFPLTAIVAPWQGAIVAAVYCAVCSVAPLTRLRAGRDLRPASPRTSLPMDSNHGPAGFQPAALPTELDSVERCPWPQSHVTGSACPDLPPFYVAARGFEPRPDTRRARAFAGLHRCGAGVHAFARPALRQAAAAVPADARVSSPRGRSARDRASRPAAAAARPGTEAYPRARPPGSSPSSCRRR